MSISLFTLYNPDPCAGRPSGSGSAAGQQQAAAQISPPSGLVMENPIAARLAGLREQIARCEKEYGRASGSVQMIAVSKTQPASALRAAHAAGQRHFGENYLQEALAKQDALADLPGLVWHFIGPLQSNKTRPVAERFDWVHSVDRLKIARRLGEQRPAQRGPLNVLLQLNLSGEASKAGASP